jgi:hypothetical protein
MKPMVFLSHASADEASLRALANKLREKTSNAIGFFLASDGQSIPLGRNWVHKIEEELKASQIMFVFLSPASIASQWVFFEAGFAYARGIRVVPVGFGGVDLGLLSPPLGLLQGFNVRDADSLNNIIATLNEEFELTVAQSFTADDYSSIFGASTTSAMAYLGRHAEHVVDIQFSARCRADEALRTASELAGKHQLPCSVHGKTVTIPGLIFEDNNSNGKFINVQIAPTLLAVTFGLLEEWLLQLVLTGGPYELTLTFSEQVVTVTNHPHHRTALLFGAPIEIAGRDGLTFRGAFVLVWGPAARLQLKSENRHLRDLGLDQLVDIMFDRRVFVLRHDGAA